MVENKSQFYLHDRWYYLTGETEEKLMYCSNPEDKKTSNILEIDKNGNKFSIVYLSNKKILGKLEVSELENSRIKINYKQSECKPINVNDNEYGNLLFELSTITDKKSLIDKIAIIFTKKKKLNKVTYLNPDFPINRRININDLEIKLEEVELFKEIVNSSGMLLLKVKKMISELEIITEKSSDTNDSQIKNLEIPESIYVYDRIYSLVKMDNNIIKYENNNCEVSNLDIKIDSEEKLILQITLRVTENEELPKRIIQIFPNKDDGITARYINRKKTDARLNNKKIEKVRIHSEVIFDRKGKNTKNRLEIDSKNKHYKLVSHPTSGSNYLDTSGNTYRFYCNDYTEFQSMIPYVFGIYKHIQKNIFKEKEIIKK